MSRAAAAHVESPSHRRAAPPWLPAWEAERAHYEQSVLAMAPGGEAGLRRELVFCLLSGHGVTFELALSCADVVMALDPFGRRWSPPRLQERLAGELSTPQFDPRRADGSFRRYRFPARKAELLVRAREWVLEQGGLTTGLRRLVCERERRRWLCDCPGVGPKTASWFLRNVGAATDLAVLDVHILRAMEEAGRMPARGRSSYEAIERAFLDWCREFDAPVAALDLFLWEWQRSRRPTVPGAGTPHTTKRRSLAFPPSSHSSSKISAPKLAPLSSRALRIS